MSILAANTVTDGGVNVTARAWVNFVSQTSPTIRAGYNVNSVTRGGVIGDYTVTFSITFPDTNFVAVATGQDATAGVNSSAPSVSLMDTTTGAVTTTSVRFSSVNALGNAALDYPTCNVAVFR